jgi:hypothetical protein
MGWCAFLLRPSYFRETQKSTERELFLPLSFSRYLFCFYPLTTRALLLLSLAFSLLFLPSRYIYIYIGAAKERKEITRHPPPSLTLSLRARRARAQEEQEREENKNFR